MRELWLNFKDEYGDPKRILVEREEFTIGRTPENDLGVPFNNISRRHAKIERIDDVFIVSDCGSSNGSAINNQNLYEAVPLNDGDRLNLGDWLEIEIEIISSDEYANNGGEQYSGANLSGSGAEDEAREQSASGSSSPASSSSNASSAPSASASSSSSSSFGWLLLAPILVLLVLLIGGGILLVSGSLGGGKPNNPPKKEVDISSKSNDDDDEKDSPTPEKSKTPVAVDTSTPSTNPTSSNSPGGSSTTPGSTTPGSTTTDSPETTLTPKVANDSDKVKTSSALLLRRIATKDPNAFLTTQQINFVTDKIKPFKNSSALAENLKDAKKNSSKIVELAKSKNLTPQFLLVATLTELGTTRGDVVAKATEISGVLADLTQVLGNELADDTLLVIAAYDQGKEDKNNELRDMIAKVTGESSRSSREVRSIWFLHDNKKISDAQFDRAIRFLAIGTIAQNPKDFSVNAEAVSF